jgi:hypothetical protein
MTTASSPPAGQPAAPRERARETLGIALGIVTPAAVPLRDGSVRLTDARDVLPAEIVTAMVTQLSRRAADHASDERILAEAVAVLGAEIARTRGDSPTDGATAALDRLLHVPGLAEPRRDEGEAMLRVVLESGAQESQAAAARLATMPNEPEPPLASEIVATAHQISRDAQLLRTTNLPGPGTAMPSPGGAPVSGRHRSQVGGRHRPGPGRVPFSGQHGAQVGRRHRRAPGRGLTATREVRGTSLDPRVGGRPSHDPDLREKAALAALHGLSQADLGAWITSRPTILARPQLAVVNTTASDAPQHIRVEILPPGRGLVAQGRLRSGTENDPHVLRISQRLADSEVKQVWVHQLSQMTQQMEAAKAGRPTGILGRVRSLFSHEKRDRRLSADYAAYRLLSKDWHQARAETIANGRPTGPRSVADLERDIQGLASAIKGGGGTAPALPFVHGSIYSPGASAAGIAAAAAEQAAIAASPVPNTPAHLREQVVGEIAKLELAVTDLQVRADAKTTSAAAATARAAKGMTEAAAEEKFKDQGAPERARVIRVDAMADGNKARRHTEIAGAYRQAAAAAGEALADYQALLGELDAVIADPRRPQTEIPELARQAAEKADLYQAGVDQAMPVKGVLETGVPDGPMTVPVGKINKMLAAHGSDEQIAPGALGPMPDAEYRLLLSPEGMVFTVGGSPDDDVTKITQVRLRMTARDPREVIGLDYEVTDQQSGTLGDGNQSFATTSTHSSTISAGIDLQPFMAMAPEGSAVQATSQVIAPRVDFSSGHSLSETAGASAHAQLGFVDVNQGESLPVEWSGRWEMEVRKSATGPWSPVETVDAGRQLTWVPSAYTVKPAAETVTLKELGREAEVSKEFPRHTVTSITGLQSINDRLIAEGREKFGPIDRVTHDHISGLVTKDVNRLLREASKPAGLSRSIPNGGESRFGLQLEVKPIWRTAEPSGESSEAEQEEVQVGFDGVIASEIYGTSLSGSASLAYPGKPLTNPQPVPGFLPSPTALSDVGSTTADISVSATAGRNVSHQGGQIVSATSITPVVHRNKGPIQGVVVDFEVTGTLYDLRKPDAKPIVVKDVCKARLRVPENDLLRCGGRADKNAVLREDDGTIRLDQDDRALLRGDAEPPTGPQTLPPMLGNGENQLRGPGKALTQDFDGADETLKQSLTNLSEKGLVPPLDAKFQPLKVALPSDPHDADRLRRLRAWQLENYDRVVHHISAPRIEAGINQACQGGLPVVLIDRTGHVPRYRMFRLAVKQDFNDVEGRGTSSTDTVVRLGIASDATGRSSGRSKSVPVSVGAGISNGPAAGIRGWAGRLRVRLSRTAIGRNFSSTVGQRVQPVTLNESTAPVDKLRQGLRITFTEVTEHGDSAPLADVKGSMVLVIDSALTRAAPPVFEAQPKAPDPAAINQAMPVAVDAGNPADRLYTAVSAIRADSSAYLQLHALLAPDSLVAHREWMNGEYELPLVITPAPATLAAAVEQRTLLPQQFKVVIRGEAKSQTFAAPSEENTADINFTMRDVGMTSGTSKSGGVGLDGGGGPAGADGSSIFGSASIGRVGGTFQSTTHSQTTGEERLLVNVGSHYDFIERHSLVADVLDGDRVVQTVPLEDALVQSSMPERRALRLYGSNKLDLPLPVVTDAAERYLNGRLELSPRDAAAFVRRYSLEKVGVTTGLAATHTDERLTSKVLEKGGVAESTATTAEDRLQETLTRIEQLADQRRVVGLSRSALANLASAQIVAISPRGKPDEKVDLMALSLPQVEEVAPDLLAKSRLLKPALKVNLGPDALEGHLENMFGPGGVVWSYEVPLEGRDRPDRLLVWNKAGYEGDITVDGNPEIPKEDSIGLIQAYRYLVVEQSTGHNTTHSASVEGKDGNSDGTTMSGDIGTDLSRQAAAGRSNVITNLDGAGHFDLAEVQRDVVFTSVVTRVHNAGGPAEYTTAAEPVELRARITALVPRKLIGPPPTGVAAQQTPDERRPEHRSFKMPKGAVVETAIPHGRDEEVTDQLYNRLSEHLARPHVLGVAGMAEYQVAVGTQLHPTALKAAFKQLISEDGLNLVPMVAPGNGRTAVGVTINAKVTGWELDGGALADGQIRNVGRSQAGTWASTTETQLSVTASGGASGGIASVGASIGVQVNNKTTVANATRLETSKFTEPKVGHDEEAAGLVTVLVSAVCDATVDQTTDKGRGTPATKKSDHLPNLAKVHFYVKMLKHDYFDVLRQLESGASVESVPAGAQLQAVPPKWGKPDMRATEYGQDKSGQRVYQPYRPLLDAIEKAKAEGTTVVLCVQEADGHDRLYQAFLVEEGLVTMAGVNDGGYAAAFATLHKDMALMAEGRVDLRQLFNSTQRQGTFSSKVADALEQSGVPASILKGLDYTTARQRDPAAGQGADHPASGAAAGRTITPTGQGSSLGL